MPVSSTPVTAAHCSRRHSLPTVRRVSAGDLYTVAVLLLLCAFWGVLLFVAALAVAGS